MHSYCETVYLEFNNSCIIIMQKKKKLKNQKF